MGLSYDVIGEMLKEHDSDSHFALACTILVGIRAAVEKFSQADIEISFEEGDSLQSCDIWDASRVLGMRVWMLVSQWWKVTPNVKQKKLHRDDILPSISGLYWSVQ